MVARKLALLSLFSLALALPAEIRPADSPAGSISSPFKATPAKESLPGSDKISATTQNIAALVNVGKPPLLARAVPAGSPAKALVSRSAVEDSQTSSDLTPANDPDGPSSCKKIQMLPEMVMRERANPARQGEICKIYTNSDCSNNEPALRTFKFTDLTAMVPEEHWAIVDFYDFAWYSCAPQSAK